jgi:hypothetical protein
MIDENLNPPRRHRGTEMTQRKAMLGFSLCFLCASVSLW